MGQRFYSINRKKSSFRDAIEKLFCKFLVLTAFFILCTTLTYLTYIPLSYLNQSNICTSLVVPRGIENTYLLCVYLLLNLKSSSFDDVVGIKVQNWKIESKNSCTQYWIKWWILIIFYDVIAQPGAECTEIKIQISEFDT